MTLKHVLMIGTAVCCISAPPARAGTAPDIHILAKRAGAVVKSAVPYRQSGSLTYTFSVTTTISTSADYKVKTKVAFFEFLTCTPPLNVKYKVSPRKTAYARIAAAVSTSTLGCPKGHRTSYGATYDLRTRHAVGKTDHFDEILKEKVKGGVAKMDVHVSVDIGP